MLGEDAEGLVGFAARGVVIGGGEAAVDDQAAAGVQVGRHVGGGRAEEDDAYVQLAFFAEEVRRVVAVAAQLQEADDRAGGQVVEVGLLGQVSGEDDSVDVVGAEGWEHGVPFGWGCALYSDEDFGV